LTEARERGCIQHLFGQKLLQFGVLVLELLQPLRLGHIHAAVLGFPVVQHRFTDAVLARQIRRLRSCLVLLQNPDDLLFREPCSLHLPVLQEGQTLNPPGGKSQWQVNGCHVAGLAECCA
jgi:hypothetical protein